MVYTKLTKYKKRAGVRRRRALRVRRPVRRSVYNRFSRPLIGMNNGAFPLVRNCKLVYSTFVTLSTAAFTGARYRLSSLFDPEFTGVGHQPRGFDELAAIYDKYRVMGTALRIQPAVTAGPGNTAFVCVQAYPWSQGNVSSFNEAKEATNSTAILVSQDKPRTLKFYFPTYKSLGVPRRDFLSDEAFAAAVSTNPSNSAMLHLGVASPDQSTTTTVTCNLTFTFYCQFSERGKLPQS